MAFIEKTDLYLSILEDELNEITRSDDTLIASALSAAIDELSTYLYDSYDTTTIFAQTGADRQQMVLRCGVDIAIYYLVARLQSGQDLDDRIDRYDRAIKWLKLVQKMKNYADLPKRETTIQTHFQYGSNTKRKNHY